MINPIDIPMGFSMALAQNQDAMKAFADMSESEKQGVIDHTHSINSKAEMQQYVIELSRRNTIM